ncbi:uncharacterized protein LOC106649670 [Trichogramma pretiosum]|uniref:uncharacterized protein LOC106649670 n=1 Tax=Trichogramma pretiosum TaxID=7493 RepID=UPI0006C97911|nr:uncharacterized protein LOC106649670 [Trichogramma pretiosum]
MFARRSQLPKSSSSSSRSRSRSNSNSNAAAAASSPSHGSCTPWSVRAEFTIHREDDDKPVTGVTKNAKIEPCSEATGVRMTYSFVPDCVAERSPPSPPFLQDSLSDNCNFQRGNMLFTSTPPTRKSAIPVRTNSSLFSSRRSGGCYTHMMQHEQTLQLATDDEKSGSLYRCGNPRFTDMNDKRCTSTYSIVLAPTATTSPNGGVGGPCKAVPTSRIPYPRPWSTYKQAVAKPCCKFNAVPDVCADCAEAAAGNKPFAAHFCTKLKEKTPSPTTMTTTATATRTTCQPAAEASSNKADAVTQTTDIEAKNSPVMARRKIRRRRSGSVSGSGKEELQKKAFGKHTRKPARSPTPGPEAASNKSDSSSTATTDTTKSKDDNSEKRKRTVHIDVYCTGTEDDDDDDDSTSDSESDDTSQISPTVFENPDVRIVHRTVTDDSLLPRGFQDENAFLKRATERRCESFKHAPLRMPSLASSKGYESSDDLLSSLYPSQFSSYSRIRDFESSIGLSAASSSVRIAEETASMTSWKDTTISDMESLLGSKASITQCDSFEYDDSLDRERIRRLDQILWARKALANNRLSNQRIKECTGKNSTTEWSSETSDDDDDDDDDDASDSEVGWSFVSSEDNSSVVHGKLMIQELPGVTGIVTTTSENPEPYIESIKETKMAALKDRIGPFGSTSPSPPPSKLQSRVTSPFTTPQGEKTDHIIKASVFGRVINTLRKPGHHVGPAKNPVCSCEHCRRYFEESSRKRSRSLDILDSRRCSRTSS